MTHARHRPRIAALPVSAARPASTALAALSAPAAHAASTALSAPAVHAASAALAALPAPAVHAASTALAALPAPPVPAAPAVLPAPTAPAALPAPAVPAAPVALRATPIPAALAILALACAAPSPDATPTTAYSPDECPSCAEWNTPTPPVRLHGNTYWVGTRGLGSVLVTSPAGHVLIDGGLPESAPHIVESIRALGFRVEDVRLIVNSHPHYDHAGGIAALQRASGARVFASPRAAPVLISGQTGPDDPQNSVHLGYPPVGRVGVVVDGDTLRVGELAIVAHFTPGHTPGGTSWSWESCDGDDCVRFVYADSLTPVSADDFLFTNSDSYPTALADFEHSFALLERIECDVLVTPHPGASRLWQRIESPTETDRLIDPDACRRYAANARDQLARRVAAEMGNG